jgi:hypothetical protein
MLHGFTGSCLIKYSPVLYLTDNSPFNTQRRSYDVRNAVINLKIEAKICMYGMKLMIIQSIPDIWTMSSYVEFGIISHLYYGYWQIFHTVYRSFISFLN